MTPLASAEPAVEGIRSLDDAIRFARATESAGVELYVADWRQVVELFDAEWLWEARRLAAWVAATAVPAALLAERIRVVYGTPALYAASRVADLATLDATHRRAIGALGKEVIARALERFRCGEPQVPFDAPGHDPGRYVRPLWLHPPRPEVPIAITLLTDIDARSVEGHELYRSLARYRAIVQDQTDFIVRYRTDGMRTFVNDAYAAYFGGRPEDFVGSSFFPLIAPEHRVAVEEKLRRLARREVEVLSEEHLSVRHDGAHRWTQWVDRAIFDEGGHLVELQAVGRDVTERKEAEVRRLEVERQLAQAQKMEAVGTLAGGMAHDFNNSLTAILAYTEMIRLCAADPERVVRCAEGVREAAVQASELVRSLLQVSRRRPATIGDCDLRDVLASAGRLLRSATPERIRVEVARVTVPRLRADVGQLTQAVLNLGLNARDAIAGAGTIHVDATRAVAEGGEEVIVRVRDDGVGIPAEVLPRVFEPFFTTKPEGRGSGLGLAMVYACAEAHGGRVEVESEVGRGTTIALRLPLVRTRRQVAARSRASSSAKASGGEKT